MGHQSTVAKEISTVAISSIHLVNSPRTCRQHGRNHGGLGEGTTGRHWRLEITSRLDLEALAYARSHQGDFATATHNVVNVVPERLRLQHRESIFRDSRFRQYYAPIFNGGTWRA